MKVKKYAKLFIIVFLFLIFLSLTGCSKSSKIKKIKMKDNEVIQIESGDFLYEGIKVIVVYEDESEEEIDLTPDMIPDVEKLNFYKMGEHEVKVVLNNRYLTTMKINVTRHQFEDIYALEDYTCVYDGYPHKLTLNYELPEGASIEYVYGNTFTNAGVYEVKGVISKAGYQSKTVVGTLTILKAEYDLSNTVFEDQEFVYDGQTKMINVTNVPDGVEVTYDIYDENKLVRLNSALNAGKYTVVARFNSTNENYQAIPDREVMLTITKETYDMSNVKLEDASKVYDGKEFDVSLSSQSTLPSGVSVEFKYYDEDNKEISSIIDAGLYKVKAIFSGDSKNYEPITPLEANFEVTKRVIEIENLIDFESQTINYDREVHSLEVSGNIPESVTISYENNSQEYAGEYKIIAHFNAVNPNETVDILEAEAYLIINQVRESIKIYNSDQELVSITGDELSIVEDEEGNRSILIDKELILVKSDLQTEKEITKTFGQDIFISRAVFWDVETEQHLELEDLVVGKRYNFELSFVFDSEGETNSIVLAPVSGTITFNLA